MLKVDSFSYINIQSPDSTRRSQKENAGESDNIEHGRMGRWMKGREKGRLTAPRREIRLELGQGSRRGESVSFLSSRAPQGPQFPQSPLHLSAPPGQSDHNGSIQSQAEPEAGEVFGALIGPL
jgi:hypothetical protein